MAGALDGLVVLDLTTHLSGPFCGMQLGDLGADVIKIESPQGDSMRGAPPFVEGEGAPFMLWNRNKRGIRLDLKDAADLEIFWDLVDGADVVLENFRPGVMTRLGLGWEALHARNPRLVLGSISGFGQTGPYAGRGGFDLMVQAMSGLMSVTGPKDGPPYRIPLAISDVGAGLYLTIGVLAALQARATRLARASGSRPRCSKPRCRWASTRRPTISPTASARPSSARRIAAPRPTRCSRHPTAGSPSAARSRISSSKLCAMIGKPELADDPRFKTNAERVKNNDVIVAPPAGRSRQAQHRRVDDRAGSRGHSRRPGAASR